MQLYKRSKWVWLYTIEASLFANTRDLGMKNGRIIPCSSERKVIYPVSLDLCFHPSETIVRL